MLSYDLKNGYSRLEWFFIFIKYDLFGGNPFVSQMRSRASKPTREPRSSGVSGVCAHPTSETDISDMDGSLN